MNTFCIQNYPDYFIKKPHSRKLIPEMPKLISGYHWSTKPTFCENGQFGNFDMKLISSRN